MATKETVDWQGEAHAPLDASIEAFQKIEGELKHKIRERRAHFAKHELPYFKQVEDLSDEDLTDFTSENFVQVLVGKVSYGTLLFGKVLIPASKTGHVHFRIHISETGDVSLHGIRTDMEDEVEGEAAKYNAIFSADDKLEFFDT